MDIKLGPSEAFLDVEKLNRTIQKNPVHSQRLFKQFIISMLL